MPGGSHRAITDDPAKRLFHATGWPLSSKPGGDAVEPIRPVHIVLDVLLAGPHDLDGAIDVFGDLDGADRAVGLQPPAEAAADQMIVHDDLLERQARGLRGHRLDARHGLAADPDFAFILADMHRAVHRLHGRVRQERHLIGRLDLGGRARHRLVGVADVLRDRARLQRCLLELARDVRGGRARHAGRRPIRS